MEAGVRLANRARAATLAAEWKASLRSASGTPAPGGPSDCGRVLDVGCGRGHLLTAMARRGWECYGTEVSAFRGDERLETPGPGRITVWRGALEDLPLEDACFDAVSIWHVLEHVNDPSSTLRTIARILKPGGVLALAVPNYSSVQRIVFGRHWFHLDCPRHLYHFRKHLLLEWLDEHGLRVAKVGIFRPADSLRIRAKRPQRVLWRAEAKCVLPSASAVAGRARHRRKDDAAVPRPVGLCGDCGGDASHGRSRSGGDSRTGTGATLIVVRRARPTGIRPEKPEGTTHDPAKKGRRRDAGLQRGEDA